LLKGLHSGLSVAMGALSYWLPTLIFMLRVSAHAGARAATRFMIAFFAGEAIKLALCGMLFVVAIKYLQLDLGYALLGLIIAIIAFWIASILVLFQTRVRL
jgi:ATP synthase protein I